MPRRLVSVVGGVSVDVVGVVSVGAAWVPVGASVAVVVAVGWVAVGAGST